MRSLYSHGGRVVHKPRWLRASLSFWGVGLDRSRRPGHITKSRQRSALQVLRI
jgi:hypothetical protein